MYVQFFFNWHPPENVSRMARPEFAWTGTPPKLCWNHGVGLLQMIIQRTAAVRGGIGDPGSWMKIAFFLCKIRFLKHMMIV